MRFGYFRQTIKQDSIMRKRLCAMNLLERPGGSLGRSYVEDEGRPLGTGLQELVSNRCKRLWSRAMVVSVTLKVDI